MDRMTVVIRQASPDDAENVASVINSVVDEKKYTSLKKFSVEEEREFIKSLSEREAIFVAETDGRVIGVQSICRFAEWSDTMDHVGNILTLILKEYRGQGIGRLLADKTLGFARQRKYEKIATYIMEDNTQAVRFYENLGFRPVGKWSKQVKIDGRYHNDTIMELFL